MLKATLRRHIGDTPLWEILRLARRPFAYGWLPVRHAYQRGKKVPTTQDDVKLELETNHYKSSHNVHDLPEIFHYWSNKYLLPKLSFGFRNPTEFFCLYMQRLCRSFHDETCRFLSIGSGNCDFEISIAERLLESGVSNFRLECLDVNRQMLRRGKALAKQKGLRHCTRFVHADINRWRPKGSYHMVMANHSLHRITDLEVLLDKVHEALHPGGYFVADSTIGRSGHMRWPEALAIVNRLWADLPERYKYNHQLRRVEKEYENWDCSQEGFEGVRAQDILPLLLQKFHFELFIAFANVIEVFIDRSFGHNFDSTYFFDLEFIDKVHAIDESSIEAGVIKPTHMMAAMTKHPRGETRIYKHLSPEFCVRMTDTAETLSLTT